MNILSVLLLLQATQGIPSEPDRLDGFAYDIAATPDLDGDGMEDLVIADPDPHLETEARGGFWVVSGATGKVIAHVIGPEHDGWFGKSVACLSARGADEKPVFVVSSIVAFPSLSLHDGLNLPAHGVIRLVSIDGRILDRIEDDAPGHRFGLRVVVVPDVNGDDTRDILVSSPPSRTSIYSGKTLKQLCEVRAEAVDGQFESNAFVSSMRAPDGTALLVCASWRDTIFVRRTVQVHRLASTPTLIMKLEGGANEDDFGHCVAEVGDLDGDGWPELAIGVPVFIHRAREDERGSVRIVSGKTGEVVRELRCPHERLLFGAAIAVRAPRSGEDGPVLLVTSAQFIESSNPGHKAELFEYSLKTWELMRTVDLEGQGGQRLVVLHGKAGAQRVVTSRCDCDEAGFPGAVSILPENREGRGIVLTRERLAKASNK